MKIFWLLLLLVGLHAFHADATGAIKLADDLYWVGARDPELRVFDIIMPTEYGTTYNSYLLKSTGGNVLFETVKENFYEDFMERLGSVLQPDETIDYIVLDHTEPDHSGSLRFLLAKYPDSVIIGTDAAITYAREITNMDLTNSMAVGKDIEELDLDNYSLRFHISPFLHWPDTMFTYIPELKAAVTADFLASHYATQAHTCFLDQEEGITQLDYDNLVFKYYFDAIMSPFKKYVSKGLRVLREDVEGPVELLLVSHGPVIRGDHVARAMSLYDEYAAQLPLQDSVVIAFASAYGYTGSLAQAVARGVSSYSGGSVSASLFDLTEDLLESGGESTVEAVTKAFASAKGLLVGTPTLLSDAPPPVHHLLTRLNPIVHQERLAGVFGSFGWVGEATVNVAERLAQLRFKQPLKPLKIRFRPSEKELQEAYLWGKRFASVVAGDSSEDEALLAEDSGMPEEQKQGIDYGNELRKWRCLICGEVYVTRGGPPEFCGACGANTPEVFIEEPLDAEDSTPLTSEYNGTIVVLGGGAAALYAAEAARAKGPNANIILISEEGKIPYYRPLVSEILSVGYKEMLKEQRQKRGQFQIQPRSWFHDNNVDLWTSWKGTDINIEAKTVTAESLVENRDDPDAEPITLQRTVPYDRLLVATGSLALVPPPLQRYQDKSNVLTIMTPSDAILARLQVEEISAQEHRPVEVVIIGGGLLAMESASALMGSYGRDRVRVHIVDISDRLMSRMLSEDESSTWESVVAGFGIDIHLEHSVARLEMDKEEEKVTKVVLTHTTSLENTTLASDLIIFGVGVTPNSAVARKAGLEMGKRGGVVVDEFLRTSDPSIFAAGDVAQLAKGFAPPNWPMATQEGKIAGANAVCADVAQGGSPFRPQRGPYLLTAFNSTLFAMGAIKGIPSGSKTISTNANAGSFIKLIGDESSLLKGAVLINDPSFEIKSAKLVQFLNAGNVRLEQVSPMAF